MPLGSRPSSSRSAIIPYLTCGCECGSVGEVFSVGSESVSFLLLEQNPWGMYLTEKSLFWFTVSEISVYVWLVPRWKHHDGKLLNPWWPGSTERERGGLGTGYTQIPIWVSLLVTHLLQWCPPSDSTFGGTYQWINSLIMSVCLQSNRLLKAPLLNTSDFGGTF